MPNEQPPSGVPAVPELIANWRERARRIRPLECAPLTAEKRDRVKEWIWYTNRANELEAALAQPSGVSPQPGRCLCTPVTAAGVMVEHPECPFHGKPKVSFIVGSAEK